MMKPTFLDTKPPPFLSIIWKSLSIGVSSPIISAKDNRPSKSLSMVEKKWSTSSLKFKCVYYILLILYYFDFHLFAGIPAELRRFFHSSGLSFPSPFVSALVNSWRNWNKSLLSKSLKGFNLMISLNIDLFLLLLSFLLHPLDQNYETITSYLNIGLRTISVQWLLHIHSMANTQF